MVSGFYCIFVYVTKLNVQQKTFKHLLLAQDYLRKQRKSTRHCPSRTLILLEKQNIFIQNHRYIELKETSEMIQSWSYIFKLQQRININK